MSEHTPPRLSENKGRQLTQQNPTATHCWFVSCSHADLLPHKNFALLYSWKSWVRSRKIKLQVAHEEIRPREGNRTTSVPSGDLWPGESRNATGTRLWQISSHCLNNKKNSWWNNTFFVSDQEVGVAKEISAKHEIHFLEILWHFHLHLVALNLE